MWSPRRRLENVKCSLHEISARGFDGGWKGLLASTLDELFDFEKDGPDRFQVGQMKPEGNFLAPTS